jgi:hypothetical protein
MTRFCNSLGLALVALAIGASAAPLQAQQVSESAPASTAKVNESSQLPKNPAPLPQTRRGFNVVLLLGDMQAGEGQENIPLAARKALADMKDFLPYKGYRLLDTQWIIGPAISGTVMTRLRGLDDQEFELELRASAVMAPGTAAVDQRGVSVRFVLRDVTDSSVAESKLAPLHPKELEKADATTLEISREIFQLERERDNLQGMARNKRKQAEVGIVDPEEAKRIETEVVTLDTRINQLKKMMSETATKSSGRSVIDTSFQMTDGETVVVGTSKVKGGGKALIALLTATTDRKATTK